VLNLLRHHHALLGVKEMAKHFSSADVLKTLQLRRGLRYLPGRSFGSTATAKALLKSGFAAGFDELSISLNSEAALGERIKADMTRFSLPVLLRYEDRNSMAFSREARVPFLDHRLVEYIAGLPLNLKLRDGWTKYCLRRGAQDIVPSQILQRKDKLGFATPEDEWFRRALKDEIQKTFSQANFLPEFVNLPGLQNHFEAFVNGKRPLLSSEFFFRFFILEHWAKTFVLD
jgi:asparagine synthase (glutamine-hydrolysing)